MPIFGGETYSEYGYLIESCSPLTPIYLSIRGSHYFWSAHAEDALRFSREIDAIKFLAVLDYPTVLSTEPRVVEHCFVIDDPVEE